MEDCYIFKEIEKTRCDDSSLWVRYSMKLPVIYFMNDTLSVELEVAYRKGQFAGRPPEFVF